MIPSDSHTKFAVRSEEEALLSEASFVLAPTTLRID